MSPQTDLLREIIRLRPNAKLSDLNNYKFVWELFVQTTSIHKQMALDPQNTKTNDYFHAVVRPIAKHEKYLLTPRDM